jgi:hypothetical protein
MHADRNELEQVKHWKRNSVMVCQKNLMIIAGTAVAYFLTYQLNIYLFSAFGYSQGVNWVFLPAGLQLAFVLVFVGWGAIGIALASIALGYLHQFDSNMVTILGSGLLSGFAPWLARQICIDCFKLDANLRNLTAYVLLKMALLFAIFSPIVQQTWYTLRGLTTDFAASTAVMAVGDLVGTIALLYAAKLLLSLISSVANTQPP